ncbi:hypothetical protein [Bacteroides sp. 224]|uniref:hypothetical protein n=1 Tax=Bacteroides sp. 224 TaxID=2302936 RepID=UPI0013D5BE2D|nr:hypothetical protein [Bacteroides sp. 224]NDV66478.1 hypothetical protein [Bacteroides sp. 224]
MSSIVEQGTYYYRDRLSEVYITDYTKAQAHLLNVVQQFSSQEAKLILEKIEKVKRATDGNLPP